MTRSQIARMIYWWTAEANALAAEGCPKEAKMFDDAVRSALTRIEEGAYDHSTSIEPEGTRIA